MGTVIENRYFVFPDFQKNAFLRILNDVSKTKKVVSKSLVA